MEQRIEKILNELLERYPVLHNQKENIWEAYQLMETAFLQGNKLLVAGNGGSAADAEHIVGELMKGFVKKRPLDEKMLSVLSEIDENEGREIGEKLQGALPAIALVEQTALSTAFLNDVDPLLGFAQQIHGYGVEGDVFMGISTSGNSKNILSACTVAKAKGIKVIGLSGGIGGELKKKADVAIVVDEKETYKIQELHLPIYHALCLMLEERFWGNG